DDPKLRFGDINLFDQALQEFGVKFDTLSAPHIELLYAHNDWKLLFARRGDLLFAFNLNPYQSFPDLELPVPESGEYEIVLDTDQKDFGGHERIEPSLTYLAHDQKIRLYLPSRTALVLQKKSVV
ncbi:alpha amylase C-terminal domain-containing protein, partial [bacterium]|nr:alpha amylase C-terminal domain-containing protein [bacterium]